MGYDIPRSACYGGDVTTILFLTDLHNATSYIPDFIAANHNKADLLLVGGDLTNFGGPDAAKRVLSPLVDAFPSIACVPGNVDDERVAAWLDEQRLSVHGTAKVWRNVGVYGCGGANPTPFGTPFELTEQQIREVLERGRDALLASGGADYHVVVAHMPPYKTGTDRIMTGKHVGAKALRDYLVERQPDLCLVGHIHESASIDRLGRTLLINPGPFSSGYYARIEVPDEGNVVAELRRVEASPVRRAWIYSSVVVGKVGGFVSRRF